MILFLFCLDIVLHVCGYGIIFLKDYWNMVDAVVILVNIVFVVVDTNVTSGVVKQFLKLRGFFRLIRIFVLIRKVNQVNAKRERRRKFSRLAISDTLELKTVQQKVIENLYAISERLPKNDRSVAQLEYCIKQVSSQNLYAEIDFEDDAEQDIADDNGSVKSSTQEKRQNQRRNLK